MKLLWSLFKYCGVILIGNLIPSKLCAHFAVKFASSKLAKFRTLRVILDYSLPASEGKKVSSPVVVMIPVSSKDVHRISVVIKSILTYSLNPIHEIVLISPGRFEVPHEISYLCPVKLIQDSQIVSPSIQTTILEKVPISRVGWVTQQVIKFKYSAQSDYPVVVLDADTVFLRDILFIDHNGRQLLQFSYEWHSEYEKQYRKFLGSRFKQSNFQISFVTHYQVMQKDLVVQFLGVDSEKRLDNCLQDWIRAADYSDDSPLSEYHSYGRFLIDFFPNRFRLESWRNFDSRNHIFLATRIYSLFKFRSYSLHLIN